MSAIPSNGRQLVQWLRHDGWQVVRQRGGHLQMRHPSGTQHTIALGMGSRNISNAVADLRRRGLVGTGSKLARRPATSREDMTVATIAEHIEATGQSAPAPRGDGRQINRSMAHIRDHAEKSDSELAAELNLRPSSVARYRRMMGDVGHHRTPWTAAEDGLLAAEWGKSSAGDIAATLARTERAIWARAERLGLTGRPTNPLHRSEPAPAAPTPPVVPEPEPAATPATVSISPSLRFRLGVHLGVGGWAVSIDGQTQPPLPGLLPALVGAAVAMAEQTMGYPVPAEVKAALVKALRP